MKDEDEAPVLLVGTSSLCSVHAHLRFSHHNAAEKMSGIYLSFSSSTAVVSSVYVHSNLIICRFLHPSASRIIAAVQPWQRYRLRSPVFYEA